MTVVLLIGLGVLAVLAVILRSMATRRVARRGRNAPPQPRHQRAVGEDAPAFATATPPDMWGANDESPDPPPGRPNG